jgi:hypothetical protein
MSLHVQNPALLPKVRWPSMLALFRHMPCCLRVTSLVPGRSCAGQDTVVPCHLPTIGKGMATKVSDLFCAAGCLHCHDIVDGRDKAGAAYIMDHAPTAFMERLMRGHHETISRIVLFAMSGDLNHEDLEVIL